MPAGCIDDRAEKVWIPRHDARWILRAAFGSGDERAFHMDAGDVPFFCQRGKQLRPRAQLRLHSRNHAGYQRGGAVGAMKSRGGAALVIITIGKASPIAAVIVQVHKTWDPQQNIWVTGLPGRVRCGDIAKRDVFNAPAKVQRTSAQLDVLVDVQAFYAALRLCLHISFTFLLCGQAPSHKRADIPAQHYVITYWYHKPLSMGSLSIFYVRFSRTIDCDAQIRLGIDPHQPLDYIDL